MTTPLAACWHHLHTPDISFLFTFSLVKTRIRLWRSSSGLRRATRRGTASERTATWNILGKRNEKRVYQTLRWTSAEAHGWGLFYHKHQQSCMLMVLFYYHRYLETQSGNGWSIRSKVLLTMMHIKGEKVSHGDLDKEADFLPGWLEGMSIISPSP